MNTVSDERDPLLDPPSWAPSWLPTIDDPRRLRALRWVMGAVFAAGLAGCMAEGADQPADPTVVEPSAPAPAGSLAQRFGTVAARLVEVSGQVLQLCLLHADTTPERSQGLMQVTDLEGHDGMLFTVEEPSPGAFYMYRTVVPLSIGWFGPDGAFVSRADMEPCPSEDPAACDRYPPDGAWSSAIEVLRGDPVADRFVEGARLEVTGQACAARAR